MFLYRFYLFSVFEHIFEISKYTYAYTSAVKFATPWGYVDRLVKLTVNIKLSMSIKWWEFHNDFIFPSPAVPPELSCQAQL